MSRFLLLRSWTKKQTLGLFWFVFRGIHYSLSPWFMGFMITYSYMHFYQLPWYGSLEENPWKVTFLNGFAWWLIIKSRWRRATRYIKDKELWISSTTHLMWDVTYKEIKARFVIHSTWKQPGSNTFTRFSFQNKLRSMVTSFPQLDPARSIWCAVRRSMRISQCRGLRTNTGYLG